MKIGMVHLAAMIQKNSNLSFDQAYDIVENIFKIVTDSLKNRQNIVIPGFGSFKLRDRPERMGRNPRTGEEILIPAKRVVIFKASLSLFNKIASQEIRVHPIGQEQNVENVKKDRLMTSKEVAAMLGVTTRMLDAWRRDPAKIAYVRLGVRLIRFKLPHVEEFMNSSYFKEWKARRSPS